MLERVDDEVGVELAIDHVEHVLVELRRHALLVVVRGLEAGDVLDEVGAEQEVVVPAEHRRDVAQEHGTGVGQEVADRPAEERHEPATAPRDALEIEGEVAVPVPLHHAGAGDAGDVAVQGVGGLERGRLAARSPIGEQQGLQHLVGAVGAEHLAGLDAVELG